MMESTGMEGYRLPSTISQHRPNLRLLSHLLVVVQDFSVTTVNESARTTHHDQKDVPLLYTL